ncbi:MAG: hypothetical protein ABIO70_26250 [Pseudomonadota bacterium]
MRWLLAPLALLLPAVALAEEDDAARIDAMLDAFDASQEPAWDVRLVGVDLVPGVGSSNDDYAHQVRVLSVNAIGGLSAGLTGAEVGGVFNLHSDFAHGVQAAGVFNVVDGPRSGVQGAGVFNAVDGPSSGVQGAGVFNVVDGDVYGVQAAGVFNVVAGDVHGIQAGLLNVDSGTVSGVQIGIINVADDVHGLPIGLVNIYPHGRLHVDAWMDETAQLSQGIEHGSRRFHNLYALGFNPVRPLDLSATAGFGVHFDLFGPIYADVDGLLRWNRVQGVEPGTLNFQQTLRAVAAWQLAPHVAVFGGPSWNVLTTGCGAPEGRKVEILDDSGEIHTYAWPGFQIGFRFI